MRERDLLRAVTDATLELCCGDAALKDRLLMAVRMLNVALMRREEWPPPLRQRAQEIADALGSHRTPEMSVAAMDSQAARRLAERILRLYEDCRQAAGDK